MLDQDLIDTLYATRTGVKSPRALGKVITRNAPGDLEVSGIAKMGDHDFGSFQGKVGTMRRSTKGRSRRMPNGSRRYVHNWFESNTVVAYKLKPR
jgi:hypothetical protein